MVSEYQRRLGNIYVDVIQNVYDTGVGERSVDEKFRQLNGWLSDLLELLIEEDKLRLERVSETTT